MKKWIAGSILAFVVVAAGFCAVGGGLVTRAEDDGQIRIVTTVFPEYDWTLQVLGDLRDEAQLTLLMDNGVDLHSYQPTADDILKIATCDLFIYVGGESEKWVEDALREATNPDMVVINLLDVLGDKASEEEVVEGMQAEEEEEEETAYDEHVWLSLRNAGVFVNAVSDALAQIDPDHAQTFADNAADYVEKLDQLDGKYREVTENAPVRTLVFGDRFPFRYMTDDYGLDYYAAFAGCSAETEASFETIMFLAQKLEELSLHCVMTIEGTDHRVAETIVASTKTRDQQILTLNSMQSVTSKDAEEGKDYLSIMEDNLAVLTQALQ